MAEITGVVQEIETRSVAGGKTAYNVRVGGESYGAGLYAPKCKVGDYVKFGLDESRGYKNIERNTLKVSANKPPAEALAAAAATAPQQNSQGMSVDARQDVISRQSATNSALAFLTLLTTNDAMGLPAATAKGKRVEVIESMLHQYEKEFYERNTGLAWKDISPKPKPEESTGEVTPPVADEVVAAADEWA